MKFNFVGKALLASVTLGFVSMAGAPGAKANEWDDCKRRVAYTSAHYREAVKRYGPYSRQAQHWAHERHEAYERLEHYSASSTTVTSIANTTTTSSSSPCEQCQ